jgi:DNA-binding transcriptional ArsR family regulator
MAMASRSLNSMDRTRVEQGLRSKKVFFLLAETFQALGDSSRIQIVWALSKGERSVTELVELLGMSQPAVSHHLRTLRNLHLVKFHRVGRVSVYSLDDEHIEGTRSSTMKASPTSFAS